MVENPEERVTRPELYRIRPKSRSGFVTGMLQARSTSEDNESARKLPMQNRTFNSTEFNVAFSVRELRWSADLVLGRSMALRAVDSFGVPP